MVAVGSACAATLSVLVAGGASAATTLHFFSKQVTASFTHPNGRPIGSNVPPAVGDRFAFTDLDYVGNHRHHAKTWTATDHLACTVTAVNVGAMSATAICDGQIAIGGSMLLVENVKSTFANAGTGQVFAITGGTGKFRGVRGHLESTSVGKTNNSDITITFLTG